MGSVSFADNRDGTIYFAVCCAVQFLAIIAITFRLWSRKIQKTKLQLNDYAILFALAMSIGNMVALGICVTCGMGRHIMTLSIKDAMEFGKMQTVVTLIWLFNLFAIKISILDIYIKIFQNPTFIRICYGYAALQVAWLIGEVLNVVLMCHPFQFWWDKTIPGGKCADLLKSYYAAHVMIFIMDFGLAVLPIPILWKLQMNTKRKVGVTAMFSIGLIIGAFDLMRIAWRSKIDSLDVTYDQALLFAFTLLEAQLGIILASIPVIQPVLRKLTRSGPLGKLRSVFTTSKGGSTGDSTHPQTIGSKRNRIRLQKLESETDSIQPLGDEESRHSNNDYTHSVEGEGNQRGLSANPTIHIIHSWDVHR